MSIYKDILPKFCLYDMRHIDHIGEQNRSFMNKLLPKSRVVCDTALFTQCHV